MFLRHRVLRHALSGLLTVALLTTGAGLAAAQTAKPLPQPEAPPDPGSRSAIQEPAIASEEAAAIARAAFPIPAELAQPDIRLSQSSRGAGSSRWSLTWQPPQGEQGARYYVDVHADTGEILSYRVQQPGDQRLPPLSLTRDQAEERARALVAQLASGYEDQVRLQQDNLQARYFYAHDPAIYQIRFERLHQGIPVENQGIEIAIDARTSELTEYRLNWDPDLQFAAPAERLPTAVAQRAWREQLQMEPVYVRIRPPEEVEPQWRLVYRLSDGSVLLDTETGELYAGNGQKVADSLTFADYQPLPAPPEPYQAPEQPLDREAALALARALVGPDLPAPESVQFSQQSGKTPRLTYDFHWQLQDQPEPGWRRQINVTVDALWGVVSSFYEGQSRPRTAERPEPPQEADLIQLEQARAQARETVLKFRPDLAPELRERPHQFTPYSYCRLPGEASDDPDRPLCEDYEVSFQLFRDGIAVEGYTAQVSVDLRTGTVLRLWAPADPEAEQALPAAAPAITAETAMDAYLRSVGLRLAWRQFSAPPGMSPDLYRRKLLEEGREPEPQPARLIWMPAVRETVYLDAENGHVIDSQGRDLTRLSTRPADISGHWTQKEIELLLTRGVMTAADGRFRPADNVTRADAVRMLVLAKGQRPIMPQRGGYAYDMAAGSSPAAQKAAAYVEAAVSAGIVHPDEEGPDFLPEAPVTRQQFTLWAVRAMDYGAVAEMTLRIETPFADAAAIDGKYRNAVALLAGLGVIQGDTAARFRPADPLTRGEAAKFLFAVMSEGRYR